MENAYVTYKTTVRSLQGILGLDCIDHWDTPEIHPYVLKVLQYLNTALIESGVTETPGTIKEFCRIVDLANMALLEKTLADFYWVLGFTEDAEDLEWNHVLCVTAWTNVTTSLWGSLKCSYAQAIWDLEHARPDCRRCPGNQDPVPSDNLYGKMVGLGSRPCGCGGK